MPGAEIYKRIMNKMRNKKSTLDKQGASVHDRNIYRNMHSI